MAYAYAVIALGLALALATLASSIAGVSWFG